MDCAPYYHSSLTFSIDVKKELHKAVEEERYEDAALLRDGGIPETVIYGNVKMCYKPFLISTDEINGFFE